MQPFGMHRHDAGCFVHTYPVFRSAYHPFFVPPVGFMFIFTRLFTCSCMSLSCQCHPCFNTMRLWIFDPNLHLSLANTTFCLLSCLFTLCLLFAILLVCPFARMFARILYAMLVIAILLIHFVPFCYYLCISPFPLLVCQFLFFAFACTHMELGRNFLGASKKDADASLPT